MILHGFNASRPTEHALQEENRALKAEAKKQDAQLLQTLAQAASLTELFENGQAQLQDDALAIAALRRGCLIRDLHAMFRDYTEEQTMTGSAGCMRRANELVDIIVTLHNRMMDSSVTQGH